jgi:hypothetical protein
MSVSIFGDGRIEGIPLNKKIATFTSSGTWTVPAGVTYAIAHMMGGGGGIGTGTTGANGGDSSVAFASGTVTALGLAKALGGNSGSLTVAGAANTGQNAQHFNTGISGLASGAATNTYIVAGAAVTPAASITVTVGAGGASGTGGSTGGSGYVYIEYYD